MCSPRPLSGRRSRRGEIEDVILGCGLPEGADRPQSLRATAALAAGLRRRRAGRHDQPLLRLGHHGGVDGRLAHRQWRDAAGIAGGVESISLVQFHLNCLTASSTRRCSRSCPAVWWTMNQTADFVAREIRLQPRGARRLCGEEPGARGGGGEGWRACRERSRRSPRRWK